MAPKVKKVAKREIGSRKGAATKETTGKTKSKPSFGRSRKIDKSKIREKRTKRKLQLKGWLATPADWARFNAWAKINAQPKKVPEPEPIVRPSKPLSQLKKKMKLLSKPRKRLDASVHCKLDHSISKAALNAVPSKRTILLALPNIKLLDYGRVYYKVSPASLKYQPSQRIIELSQPRILLPEECKPPRLSMCEARGLDEERLRKLALAKKLLDCPQQLTEEEIEELFTPRGIKRTALAYEITPWMSFLAVPKYTKIKERKDEMAITWKRMIIEETPKRGKIALTEQKKREQEARRGKKRKCEDDKKRKKFRGEGDSKRTTEQQAEDEEVEDEIEEEEKSKAKKRKIEKHAWRFAPHPCKDDPHSIKRAALKGKASPRMKELAKPPNRKSKVIRTDAFTVKKSALSASASERIESLAKPKSPRSPIQRKPPREKDKYGRAIFEIIVYEKVLPKTKPYKMGECPTSKKKTAVKRRPIDPIVYQSTFDPCIYPDLAKRQKMERRRAEKLSGMKTRKRRKRKKKSLTSKRYETAKKDEKEDEKRDEKENEEEEDEEDEEEEKEDTDIELDEYEDQEEEGVEGQQE